MAIVRKAVFSRLATPAIKSQPRKQECASIFGPQEIDSAGAESGVANNKSLADYSSNHSRPRDENISIFSSTRQRSFAATFRKDRKLNSQVSGRNKKFLQDQITNAFAASFRTPLSPSGTQGELNRPRDHFLLSLGSPTAQPLSQGETPSPPSV